MTYLTSVYNQTAMWGNYSYDLADIQIKKLALLADKINEYDDDRFNKIDDTYIQNIGALKLDEVNWVKATRMFNYEIISLWIIHEAFNREQKLRIINLESASKTPKPDFGGLQVTENQGLF